MVILPRDRARKKSLRCARTDHLGHMTYGSKCRNSNVNKNRRINRKQYRNDRNGRKRERIVEMIKGVYESWEW
jgi:hypothetical protein